MNGRTDYGNSNSNINSKSQTQSQSQCQSQSQSQSQSNNNSMDLDDLCAFCLDRIHDPVQLHCMHHFCRSCLSLYREARNWQAKRCPLCRRYLEACPIAMQNNVVSFKGNWRLTFVLLLALLTFSLGPFYLLLIYW